MITKAIVRQLGFSALAAVATGLAAPAAASTVDRVEADGAYSLNGGAVVPLQQGLPTNPVDVVTFTSAGADSAALHSYGSSSGFFGTRSSGGGTYDVTSAFHIAETITNDTAYAQIATFTFTIAPGLIMNAVGSPLTGSDFVTSGLVFAVKRDGVLKFGSEATLTTTLAGTTFLSSGADLYAPSGSSYGGASNYYTINGLTMTISLGTIAAGASFDFTYDLSSFASGSSILSGPGYNPGGTFYVPAQFHEVPAPASRGGPSTNVATGPATDLAPEHWVPVISTDIGPGVSQSFASSGDPFDIDATTGLPVYTYKGAGPSAATINMIRAVPEPAVWGLMILGFGLTGVSLRRRNGLRAVSA